MRGEQRLVVRDDAGGARLQVADQLRLGRGDVLDRPEDLQVDRPDVDDHADVRLRDGDQLGDLPLPAHGHLEHEQLGVVGRGEDRERQPDLGVPVLGGAVRLLVRRDERGEDVLGGGFAGGAGNADDGGV